MRTIYRILAILLIPIMILSFMPVAFAAEHVTVTWITPEGQSTESVATGSTITFPNSRDLGENVFVGWVTKSYLLCEGSAIQQFYPPETEKIQNEDATFYALYSREETWEAARFALTGERESYEGEWAIVGVDMDYETGSFIYSDPLALGEHGQVISVRYLNGTTAVDADGFNTSATNIVYKIRLCNDGTYTIQNLKNSKYLTISNMTLAYVDKPDGYSYWNIGPDDYGYDSITSSKNEDLYLLYDFFEGYFAIFDNTQPYYESYYPLEYFFIDLYARSTTGYMYTTEVETEEVGHDCPSLRYMDLDPNGWYHEGVDFVLTRAYMNGVSNDTFRPNGTLNRAMVATVLYRIAGEPEVEGSSVFSDVAGGAWYTKAVIWAQVNGIVTGYNDNTFRPTKEITRQEMAVMLARYALIMGVEISSGADLNAYPDANGVASWAKEAMSWCVERGLINGVQSGGVSNLKPGNNATRAQFATIMMRYITME